MPAEAKAEKGRDLPLWREEPTTPPPQHPGPAALSHSLCPCAGDLIMGGGGFPRTPAAEVKLKTQI